MSRSWRCARSSKRRIHPAEECLPTRDNGHHVFDDYETEVPSTTENGSTRPSSPQRASAKPPTRTSRRTWPLCNVLRAGSSRRPAARATGTGLRMPLGVLDVLVGVCDHLCHRAPGQVVALHLASDVERTDQGEGSVERDPVSPLSSKYARQARSPWMCRGCRPSPGASLGLPRPALFAAVQLAEVRTHEKFEPGQAARPPDGTAVRSLVRALAWDATGQSTPSITR
jgi:hypothetical protein